MVLAFYKAEIKFLLWLILLPIFGLQSQLIGIVLSIATLLFFFYTKTVKYIVPFFLGILVYSDNFSLNFATSVKPLLLVLITFYSIFYFKKNFRNPIFKYFIVFFLFAGFSIFFSPDLTLSLSKYTSYILLWLVIPSYIIGGLNQNSESLNLLLITALTVIGASMFLSPFIEYFWSHGERLRGVFGNPNGLAMFCLFSFIYFEVWKVHVSSKKVSRTENILVISLIILTLLLTRSRASLLALVIFIAFNYFGKKISPLAGIFIVLIMVVAYDYMIELLVDMLYALDLQELFRLEGSQGIDTGSGRLIAWKFAWEEIQKSFFFGRGWSYDEFWIFGPIQKVLLMLNHQGGVHNTFLILWLNTGIIGLTLFLLGLLFSFIRISTFSSLALPMLYASIFQANFEPWLQASLNPYTIVFIICLTIITFKYLNFNNNSVEQ